MDGGILSVTSAPKQTTLRFRPDRGRANTLTLPNPERELGPLDATTLLGGDGSVAILKTTYASRYGFPSSMCGGGTETVIRVVTLRPVLRQSWSRLVESCWRTIESGAATWRPQDRTLRLEITTFGGETVHHDDWVYRVDPQGGVQLVETRKLE